MNEREERVSPVEFRVLLVTRFHTFCHRHCLRTVRVHTLTNDSRHSRVTPPRRAILGGVLAHAAGVLQFDRLRFLPVHTDCSNTWRVSKGTCVRMDKRKVHTRALYANYLILRILHFEIIK